MLIKSQKDFFSGLMFAAVGGGFAWGATHYSIGTGARTSIENQIKSVGSNVVIVSAGSGVFGPVRQGQGAVTTLTADDANAIKDGVAGVRYVSPTLNSRSQIVSTTSNWNTQIQGVGADLATIRSCSGRMPRYGRWAARR